MRKFFVFIYLIAFLPFLGAQEESEDVLEKISSSIARVFCTSNVYNFDSPWQPPFQIEGSGSASIIQGGWILTNAHVVSGGVNIYLKREDDVALYPAKILEVQHDYDLALLQVDDPQFFKGVNPLEIGEMPFPRDEIYTLGYPTGGEKLSITKGVISRTEIQTSSHSGLSSVFTQIDAPINPGNSGGAVVKDGKLVGVPTQGMNYGQNLGYMVPQMTIVRFLKAYKQGLKSGLPSLDIAVQDFRNPDLREFVGLAPDEGGFLVTNLIKASVAEGILQKLDVILEINGHKIASDGSYSWRKGERISSLHLIKSQMIGDSLRLKLFRDGKYLEKEVVLRNAFNDAKLVKRRSFDKAPRYFLWGSLVFQPLDENYLGIWGDDWLSTAPKSLVHLFLDGEKTQERDEVVILSRILPHPSNLGYNQMGRGQVVKHLNGKKVKSLSQLLSMLEKLDEDFVDLEFEDQDRLILKRNTLKKSHQEVMKTYGIYHDRSKDL